MKLFGFLFVTILIKTYVRSKSDEDEFPKTCNIGTADRILLLQQPDGPSAREINFRQRHRVKACGHTPYYPLSERGVPINQGDSDEMPGKGSFPYWGANILTQLGFVKSSRLTLYYLSMRSNESIFLQNLAPSAEQGFESEDMNEFINKAVEKATAALIKEGMDPETARKQIQDELESYSQIVLAGSIPWDMNTNGAWLEVQTKLINCHDESALCNHGIDVLAAERDLLWVQTKKSNRIDYTLAVKKPSFLKFISMKDVDRYTAFCHLEKQAYFRESVMKGAVSVPAAIGMAMMVPLGLVLGIAAIVIYFTIQISYKILYFLVRAVIRTGRSIASLTTNTACL